jgi:membrane-bound lytic murein transglycosylase D
MSILTRAIAVCAVVLSVNQYSYSFSYVDSTANGVDPLITKLDSLSGEIFTRDKIFASDADVLASVNMPIDLIPKYTEEEIRQKMMLMPTEVPMVLNSQVKQFIDLFAYKRRTLMARTLANSQMYFPIFEAVLDRKGLPMELKYLPVIESALNPIAVSSAGATGLWQMMYGTGTLMGLDVNSYTDERRDPTKATEAAVEYLNKLYKMYGDWHLVLAAYNSGPGNVNKAIARAGGVKNFWLIMNYLPAETRSYVPLYIAATYVMEHASDYKLLSTEPRRDLYAVDTVLVTAKVSLKHISDVLGISTDELQFLNPSIKKGIVPFVQNGYPLNMPINYFASFEAMKDVIMIDSSLLQPNTEDLIAAAPKLLYHKVKQNESISRIAVKYGVTSASIKKWNGLKNYYIYPGQKLKIYTAPAEATTAPGYAQVFAPKPIEKAKVDTNNSDDNVVKPNTAIAVNKTAQAVSE